MDYLKEKGKKALFCASFGFTTLATGLTAFAETGAGEGSGIVTSAITEAVTSVKGDAATVIGAAVGLGAIFWGAQVLWSKFKAMAK